MIANEDQAALAGKWVKWLGNWGSVGVRGNPEELLTGGTRRVPATCWRDHRLGSAGTSGCVWGATGESNEPELATVWTVCLSPVW